METRDLQTAAASLAHRWNDRLAGMEEKLGNMDLTTEERSELERARSTLSDCLREMIELLEISVD